MKLFHIGTREEGSCRPGAIFVFELLRGVPRWDGDFYEFDRKALRGFTTSIALPMLYKNDWHDFFEWDRRKWCRQYPVVSWWFRFNAGNKLNTDIKTWWKPA